MPINDTRGKQQFKFSKRSSTQNLDDLSSRIGKDNNPILDSLLDPSVKKKHGILTAQEQLDAELGTTQDTQDKPKDIWTNLGDFGKTIVSGMEQSAGAVADAAIQAGGVVSEGINQISGGTDEEKLKRTIDNMKVAEDLRKGLHNLSDWDGKKIAGTSAADESARKISQGQGDINDITKVGLTGLNVGASAMTLANPVSNVGKTIAGNTTKNIVKDVANNAIIGAVGGGADAGANDRNILEGAAMGAVAGGVLSAAGNAFGAIRKVKNGKELSSALNSTTDVSTSAKSKLKELADSGMSGKAFKTEMDRIIKEEESIAAVGKNIPEDLLNTDITDPNISTVDKVNALAKGTDTTNGKTIEKSQLQLPSTSESADVLQKQLDDIYAGNLPDNMYDVKTADGKSVTPEDIARATDKQVAILDNQKAQLMKQTTSTNVVEAENAQKTINQIDDQIASIKSGQTDAVMTTMGAGASKEVNAGRVREAITDLTKRRDMAVQQAKADAEFKASNSWKGTGRSADQVGKELSDLKSGKLTEDVLSLSPNFSSLDDVEKHIPELSTRINALRQNLETVKGELNKFITKDKGDKAKLRIDNKYDRMRQQLEGFSPERQKYELKGINEAHQVELSNIDADVAKDAPQVAQLSKKLDQLNASEQDFILKANYVKNTDPNRFRVLDETKIAAKETALTKEHVDASTFPDPDETNSVIVDTAIQSGDKKQFQTKLENDDAVKKSFQAKVESAMALSQKNLSYSWNVITAPTELLRKAGDRGSAIADAIEEAHAQFSMARGKFDIQAKQWARTLRKEKGAADNVFQWLDGKDVKLSESSQAIANEMRNFLNDHATKLGLTDETKIANYIPHMFEQSFGHKYGDLEKAAAMIRYGIDEAGKKISDADIKSLEKTLSTVDAESLAFLRSNNAWKIKNGFLEKRTGATGYQQDLFKVLSSYDNIANKKVIYEPALKYASAVSNGMDESVGRLVVDLSKKIRGERSPIADKLLDKIVGEGNTVKTLAVGRKLSNASTMGLSPLTWMKQLQDTTRVFADRDLADITKAMPAAIEALKPYSPSYNKMFKSGILENNQASFLRGTSIGNSSTRKSNMSDFVDITDRLLHSGLTAMDRSNRAINFYATLNELEKTTPGFNKIFDKGLDNIDSLTSAERTIFDKGLNRVHETNTKTVFTFSDKDMPIHLNNAIGRSAVSMQTYNLQSAKYIYNLVKASKNDSKARASLAKYAVGNALFMASIGVGLGLKPQDVIPFGNNFADGQLPQSPIVAQLVGNQYQKGLIPTSGNMIAALFGNGEVDTAAADLGGALVDTAKGYIPVQTQINRTVKGIESVQGGQARSGDITDMLAGNTGKIQFNQDQDPYNAAMAAVFGKNTTDAGKQWKADGSKTLSESQMRLEQKADSGVDINKITPEQRAMYTDFYNQVNNANPYNFDTKQTKRADTSSKAKEAIRSGNQAKAYRLVKDYNEKAADKLKQFTKQYGTKTLPSAIVEQMQKQFIDYQDIVDSIK